MLKDVYIMADLVIWVAINNAHFLNGRYLDGFAPTLTKKLRKQHERDERLPIRGLKP